MKIKVSSRNVLLIAGILGMLAVVLGAFGAHGLKELLSEDQLNSYKTGVNYQFYHALVLLFLGLVIKRNESSWFKRASIFFIAGILLFSGSIYLLSTRELLGLSNYKWLGPITPVGGIFFILGWLSICIGAFKDYDK